jgi:hypothetical protein
VLVLPPALQGIGDQASALKLSRSGSTDVGRVLGASLTTREVPSNLEPGLRDAEGDMPVTSSNGCHLNFSQVAQNDCVFGDPTADRTILLFGDSHAEQWFGGLDALAKLEGWRLVSWTKAACPLADVILFNDQIKRDYTECGQWRDEALDRIDALAPAIIIASQADTLGGAAFPNEEWAERTADTVDALTPLAGQVILLADTPFPGESVPDCLAAHLTNASSCTLDSFDAAETGSDGAYLRERRAAVATAMEGIDVPVIDPTGWFCTASMCPPIVGNTLVYRDNSHMTQYYSRALEPLLELELEPYLTAAGGER